MSVRLSAPSRQEMKSPRSAIPASDGGSTRCLKHANAPPPRLRSSWPRMPERRRFDDARSLSHSYIGREGGMNEGADSGIDLSSDSRPGGGVQYAHQENVCQL